MRKVVESYARRPFGDDPHRPSPTRETIRRVPSHNPCWEWHPHRRDESLVAITLRLPANDMTGRHHFLELWHEGVYRLRFVKKFQD